MGKKTFLIFQNLNKSSLEMQFVMQCAPIIVGSKISNLFIIRKEYYEIFKKTISDSKIECFLLYEDDKKVTLFLYIKNKLANYINEKEVKKVLKKFKYDDFRIEQLLDSFKNRYSQYKSGNKEFTHEMGLLLGYPVDDVIGFMENDGKNFLHSGYWKVYSNIDEKVKIFNSYEKAKERLIHLLSQGFDIIKILEKYNIKTTKKSFIA